MAKWQYFLSFETALTNIDYKFRYFPEPAGSKEIGFTEQVTSTSRL